MDSAKLYSVGSKMQKDAVQFALKSVKLDLKPGDRILDIGCGTGDSSRWLVDECPDIAGVTGVDISSKMIDFARENNSHPKVSYELIGDAGIPASWKPEWENHFDKIITTFTLHWVQDFDAALAGMHKCLKPGGIAWLLYPDGKSFLEEICNNLMSKYPAWIEYSKDYELPNYTHNQSPNIKEQFSHRVEKIGFKVDYIEHLQKNHEYKNEEGIKEILRPFMDNFKFIPKERHEEFLHDIHVEANNLLPKHGIEDRSNITILYLINAIIRKQ